MQALGARFRIALLVLATLVIGVVSCDSPTDPQPLVTVQPGGLLTLNVGDTLTVRAVVTHARPAVRFTSSNAAVASVEESSGLVRAISAGEVTITAISVDQPDATGSVEVHVQDFPSSVVIEQILNSAGGLIDHTGVTGNINVRLAVELGAATRLEVRVDTTLACEQSFVTNPASAAPGLRISSAALAAATITCPINTAAFDATTGRPAFLNGAVTIRARLLGSDSRVRSETAGFPITLANRDTLVAQVTATKRATDVSGLQWIDGDIGIELLPVLFNRNVTLKVAEFLYQPPGGRLQTRSDTLAPFRGVLEEDSLPSLTHEAMLVFVQTATTAGQPGPRLVVGPLRYDNQAPLPGVVSPRDWMGPQTSFADRFAPFVTGETGVGRAQARFYAGDPILSDSALVARGKAVTTGADLAAGGFGSYRSAVLVCDALENCVLRSGFRFGVDLTPPTVEEVSLRDRAINPGADLTLRVQDELSGIDARPVEAIVMSLDADASISACGPAVESVNLPGHDVAGGCSPDTLGTVIPVPRTTPGYYTYTATPFDRAGNRGPTVVRRILVDRVRPELTSFSPPGQYLPGDQGSFTATASDNLDLVDIVFRLSFPAGSANAPIAAIAIPFATDSAVVGTPFDAEITTSGQRTSRFPIVRTLTTIIGSVRSTVVVDSVQVQAVDAAGLTASLSRALTLGGTTPTADPFAAAATAETNIVPDRVCTTRNCQPGDATTLRVSLRITGTSALTQPFARVYYYRRDLGTGTVTMLGSAFEPQGVVADGQASFTYPFTYTPAEGLEGSYTIFAVGVNSAGHALRGDGKTVTFFTR